MSHPLAFVLDAADCIAYIFVNIFKYNTLRDKRTIAF
nr:MAG TPA: dGTP triphosphohydrolase [Caudoviricetes sp.]